MSHTTGSVGADLPDHVDKVDLDVLENMLSFYIRSLDIALARDLDQRLARLPVARGKGKVTAILLIDSHPGIRPSVIADLSLKDRSAMGRILDRFEASGLIERRVARGDNRAQELFITEKGAALAARVRKITVEQSESFFGQIIPAAEQATLIDILRRAYCRLREAG